MTALKTLYKCENRKKTLILIYRYLVLIFPKCKKSTRSCWRVNEGSRFIWACTGGGAGPVGCALGDDRRVA